MKRKRNFYAGTHIARLPQELQDKAGVPPVVGRLLSLPAELLDAIFRIPINEKNAAATRIQRRMRGQWSRNWFSIFGIYGNPFKQDLYHTYQRKWHRYIIRSRQNKARLGILGYLPAGMLAGGVSTNRLPYLSAALMDEWGVN